MELAATACVKSRLANSGQVCIAAKRLIIVDEVYPEFLQKVLTKISNYRMGDPMDTSTDLGPIAREDLRMQVHQQVLKCVQMGAELMCGGVLPSTQGFFYPITVLTNITADMPAMQEEIFGPVISLIRVQNEEEAINVANQTQFGLAASVFTSDVKRGEKIARDKIHAGICYVNSAVSSTPSLPFGGIKTSGYGRELGREGLCEFMNIKTIACD